MSDVISDLSSLMSLEYVRQQVIDVKVVDPPRSLVIPTPGVRGMVQREFVRNEVMTIKLSGAVVEMATGLTLMNGGFVLAPYSSHWIEFLARGGFTHELYRLKQSAKPVKGTWTVAPEVRHFWHFIAEHLPALIRTADAGVDSILVPVGQPSWYYEFVAGIFSNVEQIDPGPHCIEKFVVTTSHAPASESDVAIVRETFIGTQSTPKRDIVYLSRASSQRRPPGEEDRCEAIREAGFEVFEVGELGAREQIEYFASTSIICGYAGSGFANMLWMRPRSHVLSLYEPGVRDDFTVPLMAKACGHSMLSILGSTPEKDVVKLREWREKILAAAETPPV